MSNHTMAGRGAPLQDLRDVQATSALAEVGARDMDRLLESVEGMGSFGCWWDSKVPNDEKGFVNFFSNLAKASDPEHIKSEIEPYRELYNDVLELVRQLHNNDGEEAEQLILDLKERLEEMVKAAARKRDKTSSKTLCLLHEGFVDKHRQLENKIKRMEVVAVRQQLQRVRNDWREAVNEIRVVRGDLERARNENEDLASRFERLMTMNEQMVVQQQELRQENTIIRGLLEELVRR